jgi:Polyketide cyclase / dehydrase and lipid transport
MTAYEAQTNIERSANEVWIYAADILRHSEWMSVADAHLLAGDGTQVGARGRERLLLGPFKWDVEFEVAEAEFGRRLRWRSIDPRFDMEIALELEPTGPTSVRARYYGAAQMHGRWRLLSPLVGMEGSAGVKRELAHLKARVESSASEIAAATS